MSKKCFEYNHALKNFDIPGGEFLPYVFMNITEYPVAEEDINDFAVMCQKNGIGCIIPDMVFQNDVNSKQNNIEFEQVLDKIRQTYRIICKYAHKVGISVAFNLEKCIEKYVVKNNCLNGNDICCKILCRDEYFCTWDEDVILKIKDENVVSVIAYAPDTAEAIDLRPYITDGTLKWKAAYGNWIVTQYICKADTDEGTVDYLSYDSSLKMIEDSFLLFADIFSEYEDTLKALYYNDICFNSHNRANWSPNINNVMIEKYGIDPVPYYASFYNYINPKARHIKTLVMDCRSRMLKNGIIKALSDYSSLQNLSLKYVITEPKLSACSFITGDAMLDNSFAPCGLLDKSYLYGVNSIKLAAGAAYNFNHDRVCCELFRNYSHTDRDIIYRDTINAYARGANGVMIRLPSYQKNSTDVRFDYDYYVFISRVQSLLRGGKHVSDIALLYPIYSLHSKMYLYEDNQRRFEYPDTPVNTDYMTLINSISIYSGHDLTMLHPDTLENNTYSENGTLYLNTARNHEKFKIFVLPCTEVISLASLIKIKEFFDSGGKIIATGALPSLAFEYDDEGVNDRKVCEIIDYIFGNDASNKNIMREFCYNNNKNGGEAYFLYFSRTASDGTNMTLGSTVHEAINSFSIPLDVYVPAMPRLECAGALNNTFFEFVRLHLNLVVPGGGMFNHLHKTRDGLDIYYFSNTTDRLYDHTVFLRGALIPEIWNPHTGKKTEIKSSFIFFRGELYTKFILKLAPVQSVFIISDMNSAKEKAEYTKNIPEYLNI